MKRIFVGLSASAALLLAACGGSSAATNPSTSTGAKIPTPPPASLTGAGATFPQPFYFAAVFAFHQRFSQVSVNYGGGGSGAGIRQLTAKTVDFAGSDVPMNPSELAAAGGPDAVVQIAGTLGTVSMAYHLDGVADGKLKLTGDTIAGIYLGKIKNWNDPALKADNPSLNLPDLTITPVHRLDSSGTSYIFTDYLAHVSADWKNGPGTSKQPKWPSVGQGGQGNGGVASYVQQTAGAIGYVELAYVLQAKMTQAALKNHDGNFVVPSVAGATAAASQFPDVTPSKFSIVDAPGKDSAPITGFSWLMLYKDQSDKTKGTALVDFFYWLITDGQQIGASPAINYAPLPTNMVTRDTDSLKTVTSGGSALLNLSS